MLEVIGEIVEQDVANPAAKDDPERGIEHQVIGMAAGERRAGLGNQLEQIPIADEDSGEIAEAVPAEVENAEMQGHRRHVQVVIIDPDIISGDCGIHNSSPLR